MSSPNAFSEDDVNELIWGNLESEIIKCDFPLDSAPDAIPLTKDLVMQLFYGFLYFMHHKCGLALKETSTGMNFGGGDLDDRSTWVDSLPSVYMARGEPMSFEIFAGKNDDARATVVLIDTHALFECGMMLNETQQEGESRFSHSEMAEEFHVESENHQRMLEYFKYLYGAGLEHGHALVLRPTRMMEYLAALDRDIESGGGCPDRVIRTEEWERMEYLDKITTSMIQRVRVCNESNFRELLAERFIEMPNVQALTFYEYIRDKIPSGAVDEWKGIRDRYTVWIKSMIADHLNLDPTGLQEAKRELAQARKLLEEGRFTESLTGSYKSMEAYLKSNVRRRMSLDEKIKIVTNRPALRGHRSELRFIKDTRNPAQHAHGTDGCSEVNARHALEMMDQFLIDVENSPYDARDTRPFRVDGDEPPSSPRRDDPGRPAGQDAKWEDLVVGVIRELSADSGASWVMLADVGSRLRAADPAFVPRKWGFEDLNSMIGSKPSVFALEDNMINGVLSGHRIRLKAG
ncbi:MAG: hypothetical protein OXK17_00150 [Thaumarchaeota archaeon]|nr:hypothetical protein [Nitrososphaerota archaeon]